MDGWFCAKCRIFAFIAFHKVLAVFLDGSSATQQSQALHQCVVLCELSDCVFCSTVQMVGEDVYVRADNSPQESSSACNWSLGRF